MPTKIRGGAGNLRHKLQVQAWTETGRDAFNAPVKDWSTVATVRASIEPVSGSEPWQGLAIRADTTHLVTTRYVPDVTPAMRLKFGTRTLQIQDVRNLEERSRYLVMTAK